MRWGPCGAQCCVAAVIYLIVCNAPSENAVTLKPFRACGGGGVSVDNSSGQEASVARGVGKPHLPAHDAWPIRPAGRRGAVPWVSLGVFDKYTSKHVVMHAD